MKKGTIIFLFLILINKGYSQPFKELNDSLILMKEANLLYNSYNGPMVSDRMYDSIKIREDKKFFIGITKALQSTPKKIRKFWKKNSQIMDFTRIKENEETAAIKITFGINYFTGIIYVRLKDDKLDYGLRVECPTTYYSPTNVGFTYRTMDIFFVKTYLINWVDYLEPLIIEIEIESSWSLTSPSFYELKLFYEGV